MANIMVIYPQPNERKKPRFGFSYTWALLGTLLLQSGHKVIMHDYSCEKFKEGDFLRELEDRHIEIVIIEFDTFALKRSENTLHGIILTTTIRKYCPSIKIVAYGYYCCIKKKDIQNTDVTVKQNDINCIITAIHQCNNIINIKQYNEYNDLPFIDRLFIQNIPYYKDNNISTLIQTAKGCENSCIFCQRKAWQSHFETHSLDYIISEFKSLKENNFRNIWITDENFTFQLQRAKQILRAFIKLKITTNMNIVISSWANIDEDFIELASKANIKIISCGIESGNKNILKFYRKNIDLDKAKKIIKYANYKGIYTVGNFIIGAPMETLETINNTFNFICDCSFDQVNIKTLDYMEGSVIYEELPLSVKENKTQIFASKENGLTNFTFAEMKNMRDNFLKEYYETHKVLLIAKIQKYGEPYEQ